MKHLKTLSIGAALLAGTAYSASAQELHFIMCGGEVRPADQTVVDAFTAKHDGVTVNMEAVPWGTCQDKSLTLAAAGDPPSIAYMGSRTLRQMAVNDLIVPAQISDELAAAYQPGVLQTVTIEGTPWGYPHAFSAKALFINCDLAEAAGVACEAPATWDDMITMATAINDNTDAAGFGIPAKDFDNTMHYFLNFLYSNGGTVIDTASGENMLDSVETREVLQLYADLAPIAQEGPTAHERTQVKDLYNDSLVGMYIDGPWGRGQHADGANEIAVPVPAGPHGSSGTLLITDSIAVFKGSGHEELALELAQMISSGEAQYDLDSSWGLLPIFQYEKVGIDAPYYTTDAYWDVFVNAIPTGGPEPLVEDFKSLQAVFTNMIQGIMLQDDTVENLVTIAGEELNDAM